MEPTKDLQDFTVKLPDNTDFAIINQASQEINAPVDYIKIDDSLYPKEKPFKRFVGWIK